MNVWIGGIERYITQRAVAIPTLEWRLRDHRDTRFPPGPIFGCDRLRCNWTVAATENRLAGGFSTESFPSFLPYV